MAKFDNLSIEDLREFIGLLTGDTYFPNNFLISMQSPLQMQSDIYRKTTLQKTAIHL